MLKRTLAVVCAGLFIASATAWAQNVGQGLEPEPDQSTTRVGTRGANFLEIPVGARAQALGATGVALIRGPESMAWNVGAVAEVEAFSLGFSYSELFADADITHQFASAVFPLNDVSAVGASVVILDSGDMLRTSERFPDGGDPQFGETFDWTGFAGSLAYARRITDRLSFGFALKYVSEGITDAKATWLGGDVGALFRTGLVGATIGGSIQNIGGEAGFEGSATKRTVGQGTDAFPTTDNIPVTFDTRQLLLPTAFRFSVLFDVTGTAEAWLPQVGLEHKTRFVADFYDSIDTALEPSVGLEYSYKDFVFARVGKQWVNEDRDEDFRDFWTGAAVGGGIKIPLSERYSLGVDYAYTNMRSLDNVQTFSFNFGVF
ncbi:MAG: PorV/PorQ family protein [Gemmatimonadota bacterium]|nr:MAG: PorV/PorQ family protein [Gemmatimonadota bacterium]